jgi:hypothetical protein
MKRALPFLVFFAILVFSQPVLGQKKTMRQRIDSIFRNKEANLPSFTFNINPVGFGLYGPIIETEFKVANRGYFVPWFRYSYAGVVSQYQWTNFESDSKYDPISCAIGAGYKSFIPGDNMLQLIYYGFFGEFIYETGDQNIGSDYEYEQTRMGVAAYLNVGYRWKSKRNFYLSLGILPGYIYDLKNEGTYLNSGGPVPDIAKKNRFTGMIDFSFGWNYWD